MEETADIAQESSPVPQNEPVGGVLGKVESVLNKMALFLLIIAGVAIIAMLVIMFADIIGIKVFKSPISGGIEYVAFLSSIVLGFSVCYTYITGGHVAVDFIVGYFPRRAKLIIDVIVMIMGTILFALLVYYGFKFAGKIRVAGEVSMTKRIPYYPFIYAIVCCFAATFLCLLKDFIKSVIKVGKEWTL